MEWGRARSDCTGHSSQHFTPQQNHLGKSQLRENIQLWLLQRATQQKKKKIQVVIVDGLSSKKDLLGCFRYGYHAGSNRSSRSNETEKNVNTLKYHKQTLFQLFPLHTSESKEAFCTTEQQLSSASVFYSGSRAGGRATTGIKINREIRDSEVVVFPSLLNTTSPKRANKVEMDFFVTKAKRHSKKAFLQQMEAAYIKKKSPFWPALTWEKSFIPVLP